MQHHNRPAWSGSRGFAPAPLTRDRTQVETAPQGEGVVSADGSRFVNWCPTLPQWCDNRRSALSSPASCPDCARLEPAAKGRSAESTAMFFVSRTTEFADESP
jgi:hypothetical protein